MKNRVFIIIILTSAFLKINAQDFKGTNRQEKKILRIINSLPEIVRENKFRKKAHSKMFMQACIQNTPTKEKDYYSVSVSEDLGFQLRTYDWYEVNPHTYNIRYVDFEAGKTISLRQWRKQLVKRRLDRKK